MSERRNANRLSQVAHYIIARTPADKLGATKLNKVLWFVDCFAHQTWGRSLTGLTHYTKLENGPVPSELQGVVEQLKSEHKILEREQPTPVGPRREFLSVAEPQLDDLSAADIDLIHKVIDFIRPLSAREAGEVTHDALWEEIPYRGQMSIAAGSVRVRETLNQETRAWAIGELSRLGVTA